MLLTILGIEINEDSGVLFYTAIFVLISSLFILFTQRKSIPIIGKKL